MEDPQYYQALYNFQAENEAELTLVEGEIIEVYNKDGEWWEGQNADGRRGLFPANRVIEYQLPETTDTDPNANAYGELGYSESNYTNGIQLQQAPGYDYAGYQQPQDAYTNGNGYAYASPSASPQHSSNDAKYNNPAAARPLPTQPLLGQPALKPTSSHADIKKTPAPKPVVAPSSETGKTKESPPKSPTSNTKFGPWASNMAILAAVTGYVLAFGALLWAGERKYTTDAAAGGYTLCFCTFVLWYELYPGRQRKGDKVPLRGLFYLFFCIPMFISPPTAFGGALFVLVAIANFVAAYKAEEYMLPPPEKKEESKSSHGQGYTADMSLWSKFVFWIKLKIRQNELGAIIFVFLFVAANVVVFFTALATWIKMNNNFGPNEKLSDWAPAAKGFGNLLDFDCAIIVVPVLRSLIRWLYNMSTANEQCFARSLRAVLNFVPLDRSIEFHKLIALFILIGTVGHTVMHLVNYILAPTNTLDKFGVWPWVSGGIVLGFMLLMYGAIPDNVKRGQFEIFWYSHHCFIGFFLFLLVHGAGGWNPNYWKWFLGPGLLYIAERALRVYRANQPVVLLSVTFMRPNVYSLEFAKEGVFADPYKEGQYIFLMAPYISRIQWHPFTISSAPQEKTVTVHIRVQGDGSWTRELMKFMGQFGAPTATYFELTRQTAQGLIPGKIVGPDGQQLLQIDGPHSAPTQHVSEYHTVMVCGAGIGVTPVAATLKSVVLHRWKYYMGHCFPDNAYFFWVCNYNEVDSFRWLIRTIKDCQDEMFDMRAKNAKDMNQKRFEFHIFVTSVPKGQQPVEVVVDDEIGFWGVPIEDRHIDKVRAPFTELDIYQLMKAPPQEHVTLADVHIWNGRPKWEQRFAAVAQAHPKGDIGVAFCGNPMIGADLQDCCFKFSSIEEERFFKLHKENF